MLPDIHNPPDMTFDWWVIGVSGLSFSKGAGIWRMVILGHSIKA